MKKGQQWFERFLQCCILITGLYIIYRGTGILAETGWLDRVFRSGEAAAVMQEMTVQTCLPGYIAALEQLPEDSPVEKWMEQLVPVLRQWYEQAREEAEVQETEVEGTESERQTEAESAGSESQTEPKSADSEGQTEPESAKNESQTETETQEAWETLGFPAEELGNFDYLLNHYFVVDPDTMTNAEQLNAESFLEKDFSMEKNSEVPQILIYHTHSQEYFLDSVEGDSATGIIGIGDYLTELLEETYGYQVIHDTGVYDLVGGVLDRSAAYDYARASIEKILEEYPTIEVIIDLHRDGVEGQHFVTDINGKSTARIMFFNGLSANSAGQKIEYLPNPYIEENLAFSFQLQLAAEREYPGFPRNIYLKGQRFNLHFRPRSLLIEAGTQLNTVEEERNAMEPLAALLDQLLTGK